MAKSEASSYIQPIYKERALKHLVKLAGGKQYLKYLDEDQLKAMHIARDKIAKDMQFNTLKWFRPFPYQTKFFETGAKYARRGMIAANRAGKTICASRRLFIPSSLCLLSPHGSLVRFTVNDRSQYAEKRQTGSCEGMVSYRGSKLGHPGQVT